MVTASEVAASNLEVASVQETLVQRDGAVYGYLLEAAAADAIIGAGNHGAGGLVGEADGALFGVVDGSPNAGLALDACLIAIGI